MSCKSCAVPLCRAWCAAADKATVVVNAFRKQCSVAQPDSVSPAEFATHSGHFYLKLSVVMPSALNTRALTHPIFSEQSSRFIPLAADTVRQSVLVGFFGRELAVPVPGAGDAVPSTVAQGDFLANQPGSIKVSLDSGFHHELALLSSDAPLSSFIKP